MGFYQCFSDLAAQGPPPSSPKAGRRHFTVKLQSWSTGESKVQVDALLNSIVCGQYELNYQVQPSEWFDNRTCPSILYYHPLQPLDHSTSRGRYESQSPRATPEERTTVHLIRIKRVSWTYDRYCEAGEL